MFLELPDVLTADELGRLRALAARAQFVDGRASNPHSTVKNNLQINLSDPAHQEASRLMAGALQRSEPFRNFAMPRAVAPPMLAKYAPGMNYGLHSDAAILPLAGRPLRSDISCTLFISDPGGYQGGELSVQLGGRTVEFKGPARSAVVYPSHTLHEVKPVSAGERLVGLTFIESVVRDPMLRDLLYQLDEVAALEGLTMNWDNRTRLQYVRNNLRRMWSEPI
ncbi:MAG TPA: Fe2+-dependent dioxygenase [Caulobacteraceae bacterium]|nr:Fe2+-dependent dioxygenase [Caulobacteraceae bacterium]